LAQAPLSDQARRGASFLASRPPAGDPAMGCGASSSQKQGAAVKVSPASPTGAAKTEGQLAAPSSLKELDKDGRSVQPAPSFTPSEVDQAQASITAEEMDLEAAKIKAQQGRSRRPGVAAESVDNDKVQNYKRPVHAKDKETEAKIRNILQDNKNLQVLFGHLQGQALTDVINAFYLKEISDGIDIIRQGDEGDCLYIIDSGTVEIFVRRGESTPGDKGKQVLTLGSGGLFGELALMYAAPRAATVTAASDTVRCFVLDALDFKMLLAQSSQAQYAKYEGWLHEVELLKSLNHFELSKLAEALQPEQYKPGDEIIKQGDPGDRFFILEEGTAAAYITGAEGEMEVKVYDKVGDYFGEIALLTSQPRKATVRAGGQNGCKVMSLSKENFDLLLGPISAILKKEKDQYPQYADFLRIAASKQSPSATKRVLIVATSADKLEDKTTGVWSEECTGPYYHFVDNGCAVVICSIAGGDIPVDPGSLADGFKTDNDRRMEEEGWAPMRGTPKLEDQDVDAFDIVFFSGGHGTCVDFPTSEVAAVVQTAMEKGKIVAAVCHGPMALVEATVRGEGESVQPLVQGKKVACFTDKEEEMVGLTSQVPFLLESKLKDLGATVMTGDPWTDQAVRDGNLVTGQNPQSSVSCAKLCLA